MQLQGVEIGCFKQKTTLSCRVARDLGALGGRWWQIGAGGRGTGRWSPVRAPLGPAARGLLKRAALGSVGRAGIPLLVLPLHVSVAPCCRHGSVFPGHWAARGYAGKGIACDRAEDSACCWERVGQTGRGELRAALRWERSRLWWPGPTMATAWGAAWQRGAPGKRPVALGQRRSGTRGGSGVLLCPGSEFVL